LVEVLSENGELSGRFGGQGPMCLRSQRTEPFCPIPVVEHGMALSAVTGVQGRPDEPCFFGIRRP
jgi:hypothetical protein